MKIVRIMALVVAAVLAGCHATTFEHPPVAETGCDPRLVGDWLSVPDPGSGDTLGEAEVQVDATCTLVAVDHEPNKTVRSDPVMAHLGRDDAHTWLWVDAAWGFKAAQSQQQPPTGDVTVFLYRLDGDKLELALPDDRAVAHRIIDGDLQGDVSKAGGMLLNRVTGKPTASQWRAMILFNDQSGRFERRKAAPK